MPKLNEMYREYGCNKGDLILIMDGINIYHDDMKHKYKDSLGGIFPMICVQDNMSTLHHLKIDFPGAAPLYGLVSPQKTIMHQSRTFSEFKAVLDNLKLKKQPQLCNGVTDLLDDLPAMLYPVPAVSVGVIKGSAATLFVENPDRYAFTLYSSTGKKISSSEPRYYEKGRATLNLNSVEKLPPGSYLMRITSEKTNLFQKIVTVE